MKAKSIETSKKQPVIPIYCRQCRSQCTFDRDPANDIKAESGQVLWERWKCSQCGHTTIYQVFNTIEKEGRYGWQE